VKASNHGYKKPDCVGKWTFQIKNGGQTIGTHETREEAIAELKHHCEADGLPFHGWVGQIDEIQVPCIDADEVLETLECRMYDRYNCDSDSIKFVGVTKEQLEILSDNFSTALQKWMTDYQLWPSGGICEDMEEVGDAISN